MDNVLVVGAGFSVNAGLPVATDFSREMLDTTRLNLDGPSNRQVAYIREFVSRVFAEGEDDGAASWPEIEDIFTMLDLAANSGHHLGPQYSAADLRRVRRALIVRTIRMLAQKTRLGRRASRASWLVLEGLFERFDYQSTSVLSLNWDAVFESGLARAQDVRRVDYGCSARPFTFADTGELVETRFRNDATVRLLKPHGSINWLYCDTCRETIWVPPSQATKVASTLFGRRDWEALPRGRTRNRSAVLTPECPNCGAESLGTRFATFSYRKALDFPMHAASWRAAEADLKRATNWIFFGYSMPAADYEFKHLLKRVQLARENRPTITVIVKGTSGRETTNRYRKFFGDLSSDRFYLGNGLDAESMAHLERLGVLRSVD